MDFLAYKWYDKFELETNQQQEEEEEEAISDQISKHTNPPTPPKNPVEGLHFQASITSVQTEPPHNPPSPRRRNVPPAPETRDAPPPLRLYGNAGGIFRRTQRGNVLGRRQ